jgi:hypothetical protein
MASTILVPNQIARGALAILHNNLRFTRTVSRQYDDSFAKTGAKIGDTIRIRLPNQYSTSTGAALSIQDTTNRVIALTIGTNTLGTPSAAPGLGSVLTGTGNQRHVDVNFTTLELSLSVDEFMRLIGEPAMSVLASMIDYDVMSAVVPYVNNLVGTPGTTPATAAVLLQSHAKLNYNAAPMTPRYFAADPTANAALVDGMKGLFNPNSNVSQQFREGLMADNQLGFREMYMSQSVPVITTGARNAAYLTNTPAGITNGDITLAVDTGANAMTAGDVFTVAGVYSVNPETKQSTGHLYQFAVRAAYAGGAGNVPIWPALYKTGPLQNISTDVPDNTLLTFVGTASTAYPNNLAYHRDAFAFASVDLVMPEGVDQSAREVMDGISMRYVRQYRIGTDDIPARFDVAYGGVCARPEMACRVIG